MVVKLMRVKDAVILSTFSELTLFTQHDSHARILTFLYRVKCQLHTVYAGFLMAGVLV